MIDLDAIEENGRVTVDTAPIIYILEDHPLYAELFIPLFQRIEAGKLQAVLSPVTIAEVVAGPLGSGNEILANRYFKVLTAGANWMVQDLTAELSFLAARIRSRYRLKLPDAIQVATAIQTGSSALITHDRDFRGVDEIAILGNKSSLQR